MENEEIFPGPDPEAKAKRRRIGFRVLNGFGLVLGYLLVYPAGAIFLMSQTNPEGWIWTPLIFVGIPCLWICEVWEPYSDYVSWLIDIAGLW